MTDENWIEVVVFDLVEHVTRAPNNHVCAVILHRPGLEDLAMYPRAQRSGEPEFFGLFESNLNTRHLAEGDHERRLSMHPAMGYGVMFHHDEASRLLAERSPVAQPSENPLRLSLRFGGEPPFAVPLLLRYDDGTMCIIGSGDYDYDDPTLTSLAWTEGHTTGPVIDSVPSPVTPDNTHGLRSYLDINPSGLNSLQRGTQLVRIYNLETGEAFSEEAVEAFRTDFTSPAETDGLTRVGMGQWLIEAELAEQAAPA